jgi:hypothetical protein
MKEEEILLQNVLPNPGPDPDFQPDSSRNGWVRNDRSLYLAQKLGLGPDSVIDGGVTGDLGVAAEGIERNLQLS